MSLLKIRLYVFFSLFSGSLVTFGQAARSPFSSFGLGDQYTTALPHNQGMGGVGLSNPQYWSMNNLNPALLIYNRFTTFEAGLIGEQRTQKNDTISERSGSGNLNYLVLGIPIKPGRWTTSLSLMPYTRLNYQVKYPTSVQGSPTAVLIITEKGSGGINQLNWSNGVAINSKISVGLKATYFFSSAVTEYSSQLLTATPGLVIVPNVYERTFVSDFQFSPAISIHLDSLFKSKYRFNFGLVYDFKSNLNSQFYQRIERRNVTGIVDSLTTISNAPGIITIPQSISAGISIGKGYQWVLGIDASYWDYSQYKGLTGSNPYSTSGWRVASGFELTPDPTSLGSYVKRVTYRTGVSLENSPYLVNGNPVKDFGITFGLSLPVSRLSSLDMALKFGKKGDKALNSVEENYLKLYFGITFNDQWFIKRRFD